jgi:predicted NBD/HSP70 family sugar kinase
MDFFILRRIVNIQLTFLKRGFSMQPTIGSNLFKKVNMKKVLDFIRRKGPVSKAEIAEFLGLTFPTISNLVKELYEQGIIKSWEGESTGGRRPLLYELNSKALYVVGIDISIDDQVLFGLFTFDTELIVEFSLVSPAIKDPNAYIDIIKKGLVKLVEKVNIDCQKIIGVGVSVPGPINTLTGEVISPPNLPLWKNVPLKDLIQDALQIQVKIEKDANLSALGEKWFGVGQKKDNLIYIFVGEGIGSGVIQNGTLVSNHGFGIGEIGHCTIDFSGPQCSCGNYGCLELKASGLAIVKRVKECLQMGYETSYPYPKYENITFSNVLDALYHQDLLTKKIVEEASFYLGIGLTNVINSFNPELIIIGGKLPQAYEKMVDLAASVARKRAFNVFLNNLSIVPGQLKQKSTIMGAAALVLEDIFNPKAKVLP